MKYETQFNYFKDSNMALISNRYFHCCVIALEFLITFCYFIQPMFLLEGEIFHFFLFKISRLIFILTIIYLAIGISVYHFLSFFHNFYFKLIFINFYEVFFLRLSTILVVYIIMNDSCNFSIKILLLAIFSFFVISHFKHYYLYYFFPSKIFLFKYPYNKLSSDIDCFHLLIKISLNLSEITNAKAKPFLILISLLILLFFSLYILYSLFFQSFKLMNNKELDVFRCSCAVTLTTSILFCYFYSKLLDKPVSNLIFVFAANLLLFLSCSLLFFYDPFTFAKLKRGNDEVNFIIQLYSLYENDGKFGKKNANVIDDEESIFLNKINYYQGKNFDYYILMAKVMGKMKQLEQQDKTMSKTLLNHNPLSLTNNLELFSFRLINKIFQKKKPDFILGNTLKLIHFFLFNYRKKGFLVVNLHMKKLKNDIILGEKVTSIIEGGNAIREIKEVLNKILFLLSDSVVYSSLYDEYISLSQGLAKLKKKKETFFSAEPRINSLHYMHLMSLLLFDELFNVDNGKIRERYSQFEDILHHHYVNDHGITIILNFPEKRLDVVHVGQGIEELFLENLVIFFPKGVREAEMKYIREKLYGEEDEIKNMYVLLETNSSKTKYKLIELKLLCYNNGEYPLLTGDYNIVSEYLITKEDSEHEVVIYTNKKTYKLGPHSTTLSNFMLINRWNILKANKVLSMKVGLDIVYNVYTLSIATNSSRKNLFPVKHSSRFIKHAKNKSTVETLEFSVSEEKIQSLLKADSLHFYVDSCPSVNSSVISNKVPQNKIFDLETFKRKAKKKNGVKFSFFMILIFVLLGSLFGITLFGIFRDGKEKGNLLGNYNIYTSLRDVNRLYYHLVSSTLSSTCLKIFKGDSECINYLSKYTKKYQEANPSINLNFTALVHRENLLKIQDLVKRTTNLASLIYSLNDQKTKEIFNSNFQYFQTSLLYDKIRVIRQTVTFNEAIELLVNCLSTILHDEGYLFGPFSIFDMYSLDFTYVTSVDKINQNWQYEMYNLMINFNTFCSYWEKIMDSMNIKINNQINSFRNFEIWFLFLEIAINVISYLCFGMYLTFYQNCVIKSIEKIRLKFYYVVDEKNKKIQINDTFLTLYLKKVKYLLQLCSLYHESPKIIMKKLRATNRREIKKASQITHIRKIDSKLAEEIEETNEKKGEYVKIKTFPRNLLSFIPFTLIIAMGILIYVIFTILWIILFSDVSFIFDIINRSFVSESKGYSSFTLLQIMLYSSQTINEASEWMGFKERIEVQVIGAVETLITLKKDSNRSKNIIKSFEDLIDKKCDLLYRNSGETRLNKLDAMYPEEEYINNLSKLCEKNGILRYDNKELVYQNMFSLVMQNLVLINKKTPTFIESILKSDDFFETMIFTYYIFRPVRTVLNFSILNQSISIIIRNIRQMINYNFIFFFIYILVYFMVLVSYYIIILNKRYHDVVDMKKVFQLQS